MPLIKASEIGEYVYCHRAWWLREVVGEIPAGRSRRARGTRAHARHHAVVWRSRLLLGLGLLLLVAGLLTLLLH
ncbi:MAG: hypothetical protein H0X37_13430 [Herpetosiphonaceae bacterium]|nr:hypothetical protein [Herpetosiphonaceae bacterium]